MAARRESDNLDTKFYQPADDFFAAHSSLGLTYDDVTLATLYSEILPRDTQLETTLAERLKLNVPIVSADMDTVTESRMAIGMALNGGLGLIHYNMPQSEQLKEVDRVKNHVHGLIREPIKVNPDQHIGSVLKLIEEKRYAFSTFPVVDKNTNKLLGLLFGHAVKQRHASKKVARAMVPFKDLKTIKEKELGSDPIARATRFFNDHVGIHKLLVIDENDGLKGLFTLSDIDRISEERSLRLKPARDANFRLLCGAAVSATRNSTSESDLQIPLPLAPSGDRRSTGELDKQGVRAHVKALVDKGVDVVAVSTAHAHTKGVGETVRMIRQAFPDLPIIAGNVTTASAVEFLADCGANIIKVGQGPGSICTTRIVAGVGIPQLTALYVASRAAKKKNVTIVADGGITKSGDIVKALTLSHAVICGGLLAGCPEAPGQLVEIDGKKYKQYRGMGSLAAMSKTRHTTGQFTKASASRYGHHKKEALGKVAAEGIEALKELSAPLDIVLTQLVGGIQSGMGYLGATNLTQLREKARFIRVSAAGIKEAAPHDVVELKTGS